MTGYRLVLDASAVLAYIGPSSAIDVGELIAEAGAEQQMVAVPVLCLVEALHAVASPAQYAHLQVLLGLANVALLPLDLPTLRRCRDFANWVDDLGHVDLAAAAAAAVDFTDENAPGSVYVVTAQAERYAAMVPVVAVREAQ